MIGEKKLKGITEFILKHSSVDETEVVAIASDFGLTRFANSVIHQNIVRERIDISIRAVLGRKIGVASTNSLEKAALKRTLSKAIEIARNQQPDLDFKSLPQPTNYPQIKAFFFSTASFSPQQRAEKIKNVIKQAKSTNLTAFGALSSGVTEYAVTNSHGVWAYFLQTDASFKTTMMSDDSSGFGSCLNMDIKKLGIEKETEEAIQVALRSKKPQLIKPGQYTVVLAPAAVNEMLLYLAYLGFGARAYHEDRSFLSGKLGKKVMGENITIGDDGLNTRGLPIPFDLEGSAKKKIVLIEKGKAKNIVYDSYLAGKYKAKNTGHGLPAPNTLDALAGHLWIETNTPLKARKEGNTVKNSVFGSGELGLIKGVKRGLYVSRFWYVNAHHHKTLTITGLTRDGTFLIENGQISKPLVNLRFTQSIPEAFSRVTGIGGNVKVMNSWLGANLVPALRIKKFCFTGLSQL